MKLYGSDETDMARVTVKSRRHASLNPHAHLRTPITIEEVLSSRTLAWPIKLGDACPSSTGAAGVVLVSERYAKANGLRPAWIRGIGQNTETYWMGDRVGPKCTGDHGDADGLATAFHRAYRLAGVTDPVHEVDVAEIYAPFSSVEFHVIEAPKGAAPARIARGEFELGANGCVVNPSGGVLCANPISVTGVVRVAEAALQVQGRAGAHQVEGARVAIASAIGGDHQFYSAMVLSNDLEPIA
jgi:acetyl-CoA C-acetyltransferase